MSKTLFEQIEEVVNKYNSYPTLDTVTTTVYKNKVDETEVITEADFITAFKAGKSITDYEPITETVNPKEELKALIFGAGEISGLNTIGEFISTCEFVTGRKFVLSGKSEGNEQQKEKNVKSDFNKAIAAINAKIWKAKTNYELNPTRDSFRTELEELRVKRVHLYITEGKTPAKSFADTELYLTEKAKKA